MSTVKISQLPDNSPTTNTSNTIIVGVNLETDVTGIYTLGEIFQVSDAYAQAAFLKANTPSSVANSAGNFANGAFVAANSGATFANASFVTANAAYNSQNTTASFANGAFVTANASYNSQNTTATFANAAFTRANSGYGQANSAASFANGAFVHANSSYDKANSGATFANAAFTRANSAYATANAALANTSGTFDGNLSITGNLDLLAGSLSSSGNMTVNGTMVLANTNFSATEAAITIKATANVATPSNDGYMLHISGKQNTASRIVFDSYSVTGNAYAVVAGRTARGTVDAPLPVANGDVLMRVSGNGRGNTEWSQYGVARIDIVATEDYTDERRGSQLQFWNCAVGSNTLQQIASFNGDSIHFTGQVNPQKGFIYTPRILQGAQTAITVNFSTDSMIRATFAATVTNSFSNYIAGKIVEMWLTNTAGNGQTVVHGCLANNSTIGATSLTVASGRSVYLKYFSIDGDQANTFVAVTYA